MYLLFNPNVVTFLFLNNDFSCCLVFDMIFSKNTDESLDKYRRVKTHAEVCR